MSAYWDLINLGVCIKQQAERIGVEHEGVPPEGVVVRITARAFGAISYIDKTIDNIACESETARWTNDEVRDMLSDIRRELTTDVEIERQP
jgi:hypothetical protein